MSKSKTLVRDFTEGPVTKQLLMFAAPLFLSNLLQVVYNMVDMMVVGNVLGQSGLSAVSVGGDISNCLTFMAMGFSNAGQVIISQYVGAGQREKVGKFIGTMASFLLTISLVLTFVGLVLRSQLLSLMNAPAEAWDQALAYSTTCMVGLVFIYGYNAVSAILRGMGDSKHPFIFISMSAVINIVLDLLFVVKFGMGAFGAALATVIGQTFSFLSALVFLYTKRDSFGFNIKLKDFKFDGEMLGTLVKLGLPMAIKQSAVQFSKLFVNSYINSYGVTVSAVTGVGHKLSNIANLFSNSMNTAASSMVGQNIGAEKYKRVSSILGTTFIISFSISCILGVCIYVWPQEIFGLFTDDMSIMPVAMEFVPVAIVSFLGCALRSPSNALINGSGNYKVNFAVALLDGIIMRLGVALLLGIVMDMGYLGFWYGDVVASFTPFVIGIVYYISGKWKTRKYVIKG
jgi:putative MATE family efflux protein